jgi:hypothetical protein
MAARHGGAIGAGSESSSARSASTHQEKVECPLCVPHQDRGTNGSGLLPIAS